MSHTTHFLRQSIRGSSCGGGGGSWERLGGQNGGLPPAKDEVVHLGDEDEAIPGGAIVRCTVDAIMPPGPATWRNMQVTNTVPVY